MGGGIQLKLRFFQVSMVERERIKKRESEQKVFEKL